LLSLVSILFGAFVALATAYGFGAVCLRTVPAPRTLVLAVGAIVESGVVFLLLILGVAGPVSFAALGAVSVAALLWARPRGIKDPAAPPADRISRLLLFTVFTAYGILYLLHGLAPEVQPDGTTYHLGLVAEYLRLGRFPDRVGFYEMVPQGMEMLYLVAFAFGRHSAAKLVHLALLFATVPLMLRVGRRLYIPDAASLAAAALYLSTPVVGVSGTSSYNDAALVFYILATFYLLLVWRERRESRYALLAGLTAGFCYAIKFTGILVPALAISFTALHGGRGAAAALAGGAAAVALPWLARNALLAGNPLAPLFNAWFPNPHFHASMERYLVESLRSYGGVSWLRTPYELALGGRLQGILGPAILAAPLGLLALRRRAGRICWMAAALLAAPWFWNTGSRFLLPAFVFLLLALAMALPRPAAWAAVALQAALCWPYVMDLYAGPHLWRLRGIPWRAALRLESEPEYLARVLPEYQVARMIEAETGPADRIFALSSVPKAYVARDALEFWHSAKADQLLDTLKVGGFYRSDPFFDWRASWSARPLRGLRFRIPRAHPGEWCIHEAYLFSGGDRVYPSPQWLLRAWPAPWEAPLAIDANLATRWRTWEPMRPGMYLEIELDRSQILSGASLLSHTPVYEVPLEVYGRDLEGGWRLLSTRAGAVRRAASDHRLAATRALRRAGFGYILAPAGVGGNAPLGKIMLEQSGEWGLELAGRVGDLCLFRIK
jgi:hypothetical protein